MVLGCTCRNDVLETTFPIHAHRYRHHNLQKLIHVFPFVIGKCITDTLKNE